MFDALRQIGGPEATALAAEVMQSTQSPKEIAMLAADLQAMAPGQYREAALSAVRATLANPDLDPSRTDMGPLFQVMQQFGGADAVTELQQAASKFNYYAPLTLAALPDGAGIPALTRIAQNTDGSYNLGASRFAVRMLAELAPQYPDAATALLNDASTAQLPASAWSQIASALAGERTYFQDNSLNLPAPPDSATDLKTYHIAANNQNYQSLNVSGAWTPDQLQKQIVLIDQLRAANPSAAAALDPVRNALYARLTSR
jgi:hypothetical protein